MSMNYLLDDPQLTDRLYFTKTHEWLFLDGRIAYIGITKYKCSVCVADPVFEMSGVFTYKREGSVYGKINCGELAIDILMPVSGKLVQVNRQLLTKRDRDFLSIPVPDNWLGMILSDEVSTSELLSPQAYLEIIASKH
jgi:glycine cleavage system H protein